VIFLAFIRSLLSRAVNTRPYQTAIIVKQVRVACKECNDRVQ
jgi:hypothetical protein